MPSEELPLEDWLTGLTARPDWEIDRTVVVQAPELLGDLLAGGLVDDHSRLFVQKAPGPVEPVMSRRGRTFEGAFTDGEEDILFDNGYRLHSRQYGSAEFQCLDIPTVLRIADADDLSAYLRDADRAFLSGTFAHYVTHPNAIIPDLAGLGAKADHAGPMHRIYVFADAGVSTSPTGLVLGTASEALTTLHQRWLAANLISRRPDATCLGQVVDDGDRTDALVERPWIGRYLQAVHAIRAVRREHRIPSRISGFGGRITGGLPMPAMADALHAPILLEVGNEYQAHDAETGASTVLPGSSVAAIESLLATSIFTEAVRWLANHLGFDTVGSAALMHSAVGQLSNAAVAGRWCSDFLGPGTFGDGSVWQ